MFLSSIDTPAKIHGGFYILSSSAWHSSVHVNLIIFGDPSFRAHMVSSYILFRPGPLNTLLTCPACSTATLHLSSSILSVTPWSHSLARNFQSLLSCSFPSPCITISSSICTSLSRSLMVTLYWWSAWFMCMAVTRSDPCGTGL